jgi:DnaJ-class molecular chaperone
MDNFQPSRIPFKCVVCSGFGTLKSGTRQCHACSGKGYVIVDQDLEITGRDINTEIQIGGQNEDKNSTY